MAIFKNIVKGKLRFPDHVGRDRALKDLVGKLLKKYVPLAGSIRCAALGLIGCCFQECGGQVRLPQERGARDQGPQVVQT